LLKPKKIKPESRIDMDFGYTDPKLILPLGCMVSLNPTTKDITLIESL
jgi:muramoyltetrapeptide carboxypeptidase LdcA involved in peptidoglycan recycling